MSFNFDELPNLIDNLIQQAKAQKRNITIFGIAALLLLFGVVISFVSNKVTERKIESLEHEIEANNKRLTELDGVLEAYSNEIGKLQEQEHLLEVQLDSVQQENKQINNSLNLQKQKVSKLKKELYYERHKTNYSDSTINSILQGFSE